MMAKKQSHGRVTAQDLLQSVCIECDYFLCWRFNYDIECRVAYCCRYSFKAVPLEEGGRYLVSYSKADLTNVRILNEVDFT